MKGIILKITFLLLITCACLALSGCQDKQNEAPNTSPTATHAQQAMAPSYSGTSSDQCVYISDLVAIPYVELVYAERWDWPDCGHELKITKEEFENIMGLLATAPTINRSLSMDNFDVKFDWTMDEKQNYALKFNCVIEAGEEIVIHPTMLQKDVSENNYYVALQIKCTDGLLFEEKDGNFEKSENWDGFNYATVTVKSKELYDCIKALWCERFDINTLISAKSMRIYDLEKVYGTIEGEDLSQIMSGIISTASSEWFSDCRYDLYAEVFLEDGSTVTIAFSNDGCSAFAVEGSFITFPNEFSEQIYNNVGLNFR